MVTDDPAVLKIAICDVTGRRLTDGTLDTSIMQRPCGNDVVRLVAGTNCCQWAAV